MVLNELRDRVAQLRALEERLQACLAEVQAAGHDAVAQLQQAAREDLQLRPLSAVPGRPEGFEHRHISLEEVRDAVVKLRHFTASELAAELGCSNARARRELDRMMDKVKADGRVGGRQMWAYVPPDGPGAAFEAQQRLRSVQDDDDRSPAVQVSGGLLSMVTPKELREVAREAIRDGWKLVNSGGKHPMRLEKDGKVVGLASTPTNAGSAARAIRRQLRRTA